MSGIFGGIADAQVFSRGAFIRPGEHLLAVDEIKLVKSRKGPTYYTAEYVVERSVGGAAIRSDSGNNALEDTPTQPVMAHNVGEKVTAMFDLSNPDSPALGNVKGMLAAIAGQEPEGITEENADYSVHPSNPLKGYRVRCQATSIVTQKGKVFTRLNFYHVTPEEVAALLAQPVPPQAVQPPAPVPVAPPVPDDRLGRGPVPAVQPPPVTQAPAVIPAQPGLGGAPAQPVAPAAPVAPPGWPAPPGS